MSMSVLNEMVIESPFGWWTLTSSETHLHSLEWMGADAVLPADARQEPLTRLEQRMACMLSRYFKGEPVVFDRVPVMLEGTPFQTTVLDALRKVPYGSTQTYQGLAIACERPKAVRAVGGALGRNPLPIIIPCHRIISSQGALGGFMRGATGAAQLKTALLTLEGITAPP